jgi:hypothetical protein
MTLSTSYFHVGDQLVVEAVEDWEGEELGTYACTVHRGGQLLVEAMLSVYMRESGQGPRP